MADVPDQPVNGLLNLIGNQHRQNKSENKAGRKHDNDGLDNHEPVIAETVQGNGLIDHDAAAVILFKGHQAVPAVNLHLQQPLVLPRLLQLPDYPVIFLPMVLRFIEGGNAFSLTGHHHGLLASRGILKHILKQIRGQAEHHPSSRNRPASGQCPGNGQDLSFMLEKGRVHQIQLIAVHGLIQLPVQPSPIQNPLCIIRASKGRTGLHHPSPVIKHGQLHNIIPILRNSAVILDKLRVIQPFLPGPGRKSPPDFPQVKGLSLRTVEDNVNHFLVGQLIPVGYTLHMMLQRVLGPLQCFPAGRNIGTNTDKYGYDPDNKKVIPDQPGPQRLPPNQLSHNTSRKITQ